MGTPPDYPPGARDVRVDELPLPVSVQHPPDVVIPEPPAPDPGGGATVAT